MARDFGSVPMTEFRDFYSHARTVDNATLVDEVGEPIPWFTYPAICYIKQLDFSNKSIFEYGAGNSTLFWAKRAKRVDSVDDNQDWIGMLAARLPSHCKLHFASGHEYVQAIRAGAPFDVVVVDGRHRYDSAVEAIQNLAPDGLIILDNAERYPAITANLRRAGLIQVDFIGYGPSNWYTWSTSIFLTRSVDLRPAANFQPKYTPGNVDAYEDQPDQFAAFNRSEII